MLVLHMTSTDTSGMACDRNRYALYTCKNFRLLSTRQGTDIMRKNQVVCASIAYGWVITNQNACVTRNVKHARSRIILRYSHILFMILTLRQLTELAGVECIHYQDDVDGSFTYHSSSCQILIAKASTARFSEHFAWSLQLPRHCQNIQVTGIGGAKHGLLLHSVESFIIANVKSLNVSKVLGPQWKVKEAFVPKVDDTIAYFPSSIQSEMEASVRAQFCRQILVYLATPTSCLDLMYSVE